MDEKQNQPINVISIFENPNNKYYCPECFQRLNEVGGCNLTCTPCFRNFKKCEVIIVQDNPVKKVN